MTDVELGPRGVVTSYTVVHPPPGGEGPRPPFVTAWIRLDGADVVFPHLLAEVDPATVQVGQLVEAVWLADSELAPTWESIDHFRPAFPADLPSGDPPA